MCLFGDFRPMGSVLTAICSNETATNFPMTITTPLPPAVCNRTAPDPSRQIPQTVTSFSASNYARSAVLDAGLSGVFNFYWTINHSTNEANFAAAVSNGGGGWVGVGFSPNGGMVGSDIMIAFIASDGSIHVADRFASDHVLPGRDVYQDFYDVRAGYVEFAADNGGLSMAAKIGIGIAILVVSVGLAGVCYYRNCRAQKPTGSVVSSTSESDRTRLVAGQASETAAGYQT